MLLFVIGMANCVHIVSRYAEESALAPADRLLATTRTMSHMQLACLLTILTTMIGFGSLALASHRGLESLGVVLLLGVGARLITSTVVLPNVLIVLGVVRR